MHELGMKRAWIEHEVTIMIVGIKIMKYGPKFPNFMGVARENLLCFEHEHGHVHAQEPWTILPGRERSQQDQKFSPEDWNSKRISKTIKITITLLPTNLPVLLQRAQTQVFFFKSYTLPKHVVSSGLHILARPGSYKSLEVESLSSLAVSSSTVTCIGMIHSNEYYPNKYIIDIRLISNKNTLQSPNR